MVTTERGSAASDNDERSEEEDEEEDEETYGPPLPQQTSISKSSNYRPGPKIPTMEDLELKRGMQLEPSREKTGGDLNKLLTNQ